MQGFVAFWRNGMISFAAVFVSTVTLFIIGSVIISDAFMNATLLELENKVDVNIYMVTSAAEPDILALQKRLEKLPEVAKVEYVNREQALARFVEKHKNNGLILQSLEEIGDNPLGAVLNVKARHPSDYAGIVGYVEKQKQVLVASGEHSIVDEINYTDNQQVIDRLGKLIDGLRKLGLFVSAILIAMAVLVTFNTIRLAIYNARQEISVMRLVGASNAYIRGPFIIEGLMYGFFAALLSVIALYPATIWVTKTTSTFFGGLNLVKYYLSNFGNIFGILLLSGIILGMFSSYSAVRRYLKV